MADPLIKPVDNAAVSTWLGAEAFDAVWQRFDDDGYIVLDNVLPSNEVTRIRDALMPHFDQLGRNHFEGYKTHRVYSLLAKAPDVFAPLVMHPLVLRFAEQELGSSCLLSALLAINLQPGESAQGWHYDDAQIGVARPRPAFGISAFWAIDETNAENGATQVIPGSHRWGDEQLQSRNLITSTDSALRELGPDDDLEPHAEAVSVSLTPGSLMLAKGTLWHRGGGNRSQLSRLIVTPQYCAGWARQLENLILATPRDIAQALPARVQQLIGYNIHDVFMGYVDGRHPLASLES